MNRLIPRLTCMLALVAFASIVLVPSRGVSAARAEADPLPSWNDTPTKKAILSFVAKVTREGSPEFVPVSERVATFDNDGTLWCEQPIYTQVMFSLDRVKALAPQHPEWKDKQPFKAVLEGDQKALLAAGKDGLIELVVATNTGLTTEEFEKVVTEWLATARQPRFKRPYTECVYQPMLELMAYLRSQGFKTFIVSGGSCDFMRPFTERVYGVPREQVVGTTFKTKFELKGDKSSIFIEPAVDAVDDGPGKPVCIGKFIGKRPVMAFGNSDGDLEMLEYATTGTRPGFGLFVHHTDAEREYAYDRKSAVGRLDRGLEEAPKRGWTVASMKEDWKTIFPPEKAK